MFGLGASSQLGIGISISLVDKFSGTAARVNNALMAMRQNANAAVTSAIKDYRNQSLAIAAGAGAATMGLVNMAKAGATFDHAINQMFIVGGRNLGRTRAELTGFASELSKVFAREPLEIASAMFENVRQGVRTGLEDITKYQVAVATATDEAIGGPDGVAANLLNIMNAMDLPQKDFPKIANAITAVANATQASVYSIGESMQYAAFTMRQFNIPLETALALVGKLSQSGIRGSAAGTGLTNMFTQMAKGLGPFQTKKQLAAWQMMGLDPNQITSMANQGNIVGIIKAVSDASRTMSNIQKGSIIPQAFNMRGARGMLGLFDSKNGNKSIADIIREAESGIKNDLAIKQSKAMMNDLASDFKFFTNAFHRFRISFMRAVEPTLRFFLHAGSQIMGWLSAIIQTPVGKILAGLAMVVVPTIGVLFAFRMALLTATMALTTMTRTASVGGFGSLLSSALGMAGLGRFGNNPVTRNAAGRFTVAAGKTMTVAGRVYKGGQLLPAAALAGMNLGATASRGVGVLGSIGGLLGRALPILGGILLGVEVLKAIGFNMEAKQDKKTDPLIAEYYKNLDEAYYGKSFGTQDYLRGRKSIMKDDPFKPLNQEININIDGKAAMHQTFTQSLEESLDRGINIDLNQ